MKFSKAYNNLFQIVTSLMLTELTFESIWHYQVIIQKANLQFFKRIIDKNLKKPLEMASLMSEKFDCKNYKMSAEELKDYNLSQLKRIKDFKTYLEEQEGREYSMEEVIQIWATQYSASYRKYWHLKNLINIT